MAAAVTRLAFLLLCIIITASQQQVLGAEEQHTISIQSLLSSSTCSSAPSAPVIPASHLPIVHRSCRTPGHHKAATEDHFAAILRRDHYRVRSIRRRLDGGQQKSSTTIPAHLGLAFDTYEYVVTMGIGTPARNLTVLFDTGSDLTWVQCAPCSDSCYHQEEPLFDPGRSSTYRSIGCDECHIGGGQRLTCQGPSCAYFVQYGDDSKTWGDLARETFTLSPRAPPAAGVVFGCSQSSSGFNDMTVAGLLGLGRGESSMVSQTWRRSSDGGVFSYCLPTRAAYAGYLAFGAGAGAGAPPSSNMSFTPLITDSDNNEHTFYVVELTGVTVSGAALPVAPQVYSAVTTIVDSGTVVTQLPSAAYYALRDEFRRRMRRYPMLPEGAVVEGLDTCYDVTGYDEVAAPHVALVFAGGATINVDASGIMIVASAGEGAAVACLAFQPSDGLAIIGNMQQRTYNVVFDVAGGRVGFGPNGCR